MSDLEDDRWGILWNAQLSSRYHTRRQFFFERWSRVTAASGVLFGSAAFTSAFSQIHASPVLLAVLGAALAVVSTVDLIVGTASMARKHDDLRKRFRQLEANILACRAPAEADIDRWRSEMTAIELDEPPTYFGLCLLCENELGRATQDVGERTSVRRIVRWTAHWIRWENERASPPPPAAPA